VVLQKPEKLVRFRQRIQEIKLFLKLASACQEIIKDSNQNAGNNGIRSLCQEDGDEVLEVPGEIVNDRVGKLVVILLPFRRNGLVIAKARKEVFYIIMKR